MNIVCASSVLFGQEAFSSLGQVTILPEEQIQREQLMEADALITRSKTRITRKLLEGTPVRFVGCAVAGTDHMDEAYLNTTDILWTNAAGCNANSVAEYIVTALLLLAERFHIELEGRTLGVIGVGHIGTRVVAKAEMMGLRVLQNDPPRGAAEGNPVFLPLEEVLAESDIVTLHVPYTSAGRYATEHMVNFRFLEKMKPGAWFMNASRGEVHDTDALLLALEREVIKPCLLDVWEHEPRIRLNALERVDIGTPHIAGYSYEGRLNGTRMIYEKLCRFFEEEPTWNPMEEEEQPSLPERTVDARGRSDQEVLLDMAHGVYDLTADDQALRAGASADPVMMGRHFVHCRRQYPVRREFAAARIHLQNASESLLRKAWGLDFQIND